MNASCVLCVCTYGCETVGVLHECVTVYLCVCVFGCEAVSVGVSYECVSVYLCVYV